MTDEEVRVSDVVGYMRCRFALGWRSENGRNLRPIKPAPALFLGTLGHHAAGWAWLRERAEPVRCDEMQDKVLMIGADMLGRVAAVLPDIATYDPLTSGILNLAAAMYYWPLFNRSSDRELGLETIDVETRARLDLPNGLVLTGQFDRVMRHTVSGRIFVEDLKTRTNIYSGDEMYQPQFTMYALMAREIWGSQFGGFYVTYFKKTPPTEVKILNNGTLSEAQRTATHHLAYMKAILQIEHNPEAYAEHLQYLKDERTPSFFRRVPVDWPHSAYNAAMRRIDRQVEEVYHYCQAFKTDIDSVAWNDWNPVTCRGCGYAEPCQMYLNGEPIDRYMRTQYTSEEIIPGLEDYI